MQELVHLRAQLCGQGAGLRRRPQRVARPLPLGLRGLAGPLRVAGAREHLGELGGLVRNAHGRRAYRPASGGGAEARGTLDVVSAARRELEFGVSVVPAVDELETSRQAVT